jgi:pyridoxamine 5'-phosphate oxidase
VSTSPDVTSPAAAAASDLGSHAANHRLDYRVGQLLEVDAPNEPLALFESWFASALQNPGTDEPTAMTLATVDPDGTPSARTVLLKGFDHDGLRWFTNYESRKGIALAAHPIATVAFRWGTFERQVIVTGPVERTSAAESDAYFESRPLGSRVGAVISAQSTVIDGRDELEQRWNALRERVADGETLHRPSWWGGYLLRPTSWEFWQGRPSRVHDRLRYRRPGPTAAAWTRERLSP